MKRVFFLAAAAFAAAPERSAFDGVSADQLRKDVMYLASDELQGRATPSPGLTKAGDYIAGRFRAAGLEPISADGGYFQTARYVAATPRTEGFSLKLKAGTSELSIDPESVGIRSIYGLEFQDAPVLILPRKGSPPEDLTARVLAGPANRYGKPDEIARLHAGHPSLILLLSRRRGDPAPGPHLEEVKSGKAPVIRIYNEDAAMALEDGQPLRLSLRLPEPERRETALRNVGGILRGSDPALRGQWVLLTAHYDHVGMKPPGAGDRIFNGANDNASGTASVMEVARALAALPTHPRRSILFLAFFGEEEGLVGSRYYADHPLVPLRDTVAAVNLEQMGRTDGPDRTALRAFSLTGPSYSDLAGILAKAAKAEGVAYAPGRDADSYFNRSDNYSFALKGVVSHTIAVEFEFPDYHGVGDEAGKLDYANMARVDRGVAAGIAALADREERPKWRGGRFEPKSEEP